MFDRALGAAILKEFRQFFRDPILVILVLWLYTIEVAICAFALTFDINDEPVAVLDLDRTTASVALTDRFDRSPSFEIAQRPDTEEQVARSLERGTARLALVIPDGYQRRLMRDEEPAVQLLVDGTNSMTGRNVLGQAQALVVEESRARLRDARTLAGSLPLVDNRIRIRYNPSLRFVLFVVLSMLAIGAYMVGVIHPAASIVKEKETGTIEQLLVTPLGPARIILAKTLPTFVVALLAFGPGLLVARAFGLPLHGDPVAFLTATTAFLVSAIATGVLIGTLTSTLQQALLVTFFVLFPVLFLSGTMTPIESMPTAIELASRLSPLRYYLEALLGIFLKGLGTEALLRPIAWMTGLGAVLAAAAGLLFRKKII
ncbi:MAG: ABC transporter permease [Candidatus Longimicrobiales bacterium M2_2A_002]